MNNSAKKIIEALSLIPHPEGGYFKETYRSDEIISVAALPGRYNGNRNFSTAIHFLLEGSQVSKFHRIKSDELWHFYFGSPVRIYLINQEGKYSDILLGSRLENGEIFQAVIPTGVWFGAEVMDKKSFSLVGCTVAPGFDFNDFELGVREDLIKTYPQHEMLIERLT